MFAFAIVLFLSATQELPTGIAVVNQYVAAKGGAGQLNKTTAYHMRVEMLVDGEKVADIEMYQANQRHLSRQRMADGTNTSHGTDGKQVWFAAEDEVVLTLTGRQRDDYLRHYGTLHEALAWKDQYQTIETIGREQINGRLAYQVLFTTAQGDSVTRFFEVESGLFVREEQPVLGSDIKVISEMSDYREVAGTRVAHRRRVTVDGVVTEYRVIEVESNPMLPADLFQPPQKSEAEAPIK